MQAGFFVAGFDEGEDFGGGVAACHQFDDDGLWALSDLVSFRKKLMALPEGAS